MSRIAYGPPTPVRTPRSGSSTALLLPDASPWVSPGDMSPRSCHSLEAVGDSLPLAPPVPQGLGTCCSPNTQLRVFPVHLGDTCSLLQRLRGLGLHARVPTGVPVRGPASRSCLVRRSDTGSSDHCVQSQGASGEPRSRAVLTGLSGTHFSRESPMSQETSVALHLTGRGAEKGDPEERSRLTRTAAGGCGESAGRCLSDRREGAVPGAAGSPVWRWRAHPFWNNPLLSPATSTTQKQPSSPPRPYEPRAHIKYFLTFSFTYSFVCCLY